MKNTEAVPYGRGLEVPESSVLSVVLILLAIANIVTNNKKNGEKCTNTLPHYNDCLLFHKQQKLFYLNGRYQFLGSVKSTDGLLP